MRKNFVSDNLDHLKRLLRGNRVDEHVSMNSDRMARVENAVFVLHPGLHQHTGIDEVEGHSCTHSQKKIKQEKKQIVVTELSPGRRCQ